MYLVAIRLGSIDYCVKSGDSQMTAKDSTVLSIVVPTYNVEKYLDRCILSLTHEPEILKKIEIIIVNDGSNDASLKIARKYEGLYPGSVKAIDKENGGHGSTINKGLKLARGKYFRVIDSDDWVNIDDFKRFVESIEKLDTDLVITNYSREMAYNGTSILCTYEGLEYNRTYDLNEMDLKDFGDDYLYMATTTVKTQKLRDANLSLDEKTFYVDMEYNILPIEHLTTFTYLDLDIYRYWIGRPQQSIDMRNTFKNRSHHEKVLRRIINFYSDHKITANKKLYIEKIIILMLNTHYFIYCNQRITRSEMQEIKRFDAWLKQASPYLYTSVAQKFTYITDFRKTGFVFTRALPRTFMRLSNRLAKAQHGGDK